MKLTRLTIRRRPKITQSQKGPVEKGRFRLMESNCVRIGLRPFLTPSGLSVENGLLRLKPKSGLLTQYKKGFFDSTFFRQSFPTGGSSRRTQSKKFFACFFNPSHRSSHHQTHTHTPTHPYQVPHSSIIHGTDAGLVITALASRRKSAWRIPTSSSARQQRVSSHDGSSARYRSHFANNGYACCSCGGTRLSATPRT